MQAFERGSAVRPYRRVMTHEEWVVGAEYEAYMGRWSRLVATSFLDGLVLPAGLDWLDVGCGTGALAAAITAAAGPAFVMGVDLSPGFLDTARAAVRDVPSGFCTGDARWLPVADSRFDVVVSGLALNFVPDPRRAAAELGRVARPGGVVAAYVWDYAEGMQMLRCFWDAASTLDPAAAALDEGPRFPLCRPELLARLWWDAGLVDVGVRAVEVQTVFDGFDDYWLPFLGGQGPAPGYVRTLGEESRRELRELLRARLPSGPDGSIALRARAWAVLGRAPG